MGYLYLAIRMVALMAAAMVDNTYAISSTVRAHKTSFVRAAHSRSTGYSNTVVRRVDRASALAHVRQVVGKENKKLEIHVDEHGRVSEGALVKRLVKSLMSAEAKGNEDDFVDELFLLGSANLTLNYSSLLSAETIDNLELRRTHTLHQDVLMTLLEDEEGTNITHAAKVALSWAPGILLAGFGSSLSGLGVVLQKYSHVLAMRVDLRITDYYYYLQRWWILGFAIWLAAEVVGLIAMGFAPQVVLSCMKSWTCTCTILMSKVILGEEVNCRAGFAISGLLIGSGLIASFAPMAPPPHSDDISMWQSKFTTRQFMYGVLAFATLFVASLSVVSRYLTAFRASTATPWKFAPFCWAGMAAFCTGVALTLFKCVAMMTIAGTPLLTVGYVPEDFVIPALIFASLVFGVVEVHCLNLALAMGDVVFVLPIYLCLGTVARILFTGILLEEVTGFSTWHQAAAFLFGVVLSIVSLYPLTQMKVSLCTWQLKGHMLSKSAGSDSSLRTARLVISK